ncbi:MAG: ABC transporter substrate-binding protein [Syntrophales bacterium]|jgi:phospholipid transport system substrate-binding protein|nr:ABC transporter substrate-binding protein [Syntrophales bacterium]MCU0583445.1 ABC transporter substrate-binding protein [Syntrophales bacterium]
MKRLVVVLSLLLLVSGPATAQAATPLETVRAEVNKVLEVLRNKSLKEEVKREKLRVIYNEMFDQEELSKWCLGRNWNKLSEAQRKEFLPLFQQVLEKTYGDRILAYSDEKIVFDKEVPITGNRVEVQTRAVTKSKEIPMHYRVFKDKGGTWRCYDIVVENVSLVMNYRSQFNEILAKNSPDELINILRKKVKDQKS